MPPPTTARGLLGHFLHGADPLSVCQRILSPPIRSLRSSSLRAILVAGYGGGGARAGAGRCRSPREGGGGERRAEGGARGSG